MFKGYINWPIFFVSLVIGSIFVYISTTETKTIFVYPTPENVDRYVYVDEVGTCYKFRPTLQKCGDDESKIKDIPAQIIAKEKET